MPSTIIEITAAGTPGGKVSAVLYNPGADTVAAFASLTEVLATGSVPTGEFFARITVELADALTIPYTLRARIVSGNLLSDFNASSTPSLYRGKFGYLANGVWWTDPPLLVSVIPGPVSAAYTPSVVAGVEATLSVVLSGNPTQGAYTFQGQSNAFDAGMTTAGGWSVAGAGTINYLFSAPVQGPQGNPGFDVTGLLDIDGDPITVVSSVFTDGVFEVDTLAVTAGAGTFDLQTYLATATGNAWNITAADLQTAYNAAISGVIPAASVAITGATVGYTTTYTITWDGVAIPTSATTVDGSALTLAPGVVLSALQPNYAPAKAGDRMDLVNAPNATALTAAATEADAVLSGTHGSGAWGGAGTGTGAYAVTIHVTDGSAGLQTATVRITQGGTTLSATTDSSGNAAFSLDAGTYTLSVTHSGYVYTPTSQAVSGNATITAAMTALTPGASPTTLQVVGTLITYDLFGNVLPAQQVEFQLQTSTEASPGGAFVAVGDPLVSDGSGTISHSFLRASTYRYRIAAGDWVTFATPDSGMGFLIPQSRGRAT